MNLVRRAAIAAALLSLATTTPALADDGWPMDLGDYVELSAITIEDGHTLDYLNHLTGMWQRGQEFARSQGWITSYEVLSNPYPRKGEPDLYLLVRMPRFADASEEDKRDKAYRAFMQRSVSQMQAESGERAKYRQLSGAMLLRELRFKK